jgi:transposase-like protein
VAQARAEEMRRLLMRRAREKLTYAQLARRTGESAQALAWWSWRLRHDGKGYDGAGRGTEFVEVKVTQEAVGPRADLELVLASGHRVEVQGHVA